MFKRGALLLTSVFSLAPTVAVAEGTRQSGTIAFGTRDAGAPTSLAETALYRDPSDPGGKPPAVRRIVVRYPPGFRIDTSVPAQCAASDAELQAQGGAACPADSRVGAGGTELATGFPGPGASFDLDLEVYNNRDELIFLAKPRGSDVVVSVGRSAVGAGTLTTEIPPTPGGPPDGQSSVRRIAFSLEEISKRAGGATRSFLTTPPSCPASGQWTSVATFSYADGVSQTIEPATPCNRRPPRRAHPRRGRPLVRIRGVPRDRCLRRSFMVRISAKTTVGVRRLRLLLDKRQIAATRSARLAHRIDAARLRPGRHRLTATARDRAGRRASRTVRFAVCGR